MASKQRRTREQVRDHELAHLQSLQAAGIGKMKTDADVEDALGRYMRSYDFKAGIGEDCVVMACRSGLGGGFHGIFLGYAEASFRLMDKKHGNSEATRAAVLKEVIPRYLKMYEVVDRVAFTKAMKVLLDRIIEVGKAVLAESESAGEVPSPQ